ncbi:MAG: guanylate kinase [Chloroflexi bacterium]|nr:guanylate kinase [Chloroflexota bacterium]
MGSIANDQEAPSGWREHARLHRPGAAKAHGLIFVISGPSGVGKDTISRRLKDSGFRLSYCVTATTRAARTSEVDGVHYYFLTDQEFDDMLARNEFVEHAEVHGKRYGIPLVGLREGLRTGKDVLVTPDVQGAATLRAMLPNVISIFLAPETLEELRPRIQGRGSETPEQLAVRMATAEREMKRIHEFDYKVVNRRDRIDETVEQVKAIVTAERCRIRRREVQL